MDNIYNAINSLWVAAEQLENDAPSVLNTQEIIQRGNFRPNEDEAYGFWFARYLSIREGMWNVINDALGAAPFNNLTNKKDWKLFLAGYGAACLLIRIDRLMLFKVADHSIIQRKFNQAFTEYRIPRKQYTRILSAYVNSKHALMIYDAIHLVKENRNQIAILESDRDVGDIARRLNELESYLDLRKRNYLAKLFSYISHVIRRKGIVAMTGSLASLLEGFGRMAAELSMQADKRVTSNILKQTETILEPGDIVITRHDVALTNLFLPGFWPHAVFYIGTPSQRDELGVTVNSDIASRWQNDICVLEARKDGVLLRSLENALSIDSFVILRPNISKQGIKKGIERALQHEGKLYNFDFDFFNSDRLVCTEVIYRAYDEIEGLVFPLSERAGRKTLSAESLLDYALNARRIIPVAIFGVKGCETEIIQGEKVESLLKESYLNE